MDQALSLLSSIYDVYKTIKDGQDQFQATYGRMKDLMTQFQSMQDTDTLVQSRLLDKYIVIARDFLKYLDKYKKRKFVSKVFHQSEMLAEIEGFNQELEALFQLYHLAMGSHIVEHNRTQEATMDELVRGMRVLLQGSTGGYALKTEQSSDDLVSAAAQQSSGPVAKAQTDSDVATLLGLLVDGADAKQAELAAQALFELAEEEAMRDAIVQASAVPAFIGLLRDAGHTSTKIRVVSAKTLRRLAVRDVHEVTIVEAGGIDALSAVLLSPGSGDDELTTAVAAALANLVFQAEHKIILLKTPRLLEKLVELVRSGSSSQKKHAANTLRELAANDDCASAINDAGGITALVDMLHIGTPELCASALSALWNLSSLEKNRTEIAAVGGVNAIVAQIRRGATDDQRQLAASALAVLAQDDANDSLIGAAGGVELLVTLLQTGTDGQKNSAAWALAELANHKDNATAMLRAGVAPALMAAFRSGSDIQRAKAGLALEYIAELVEDISSLADEIGVSSVVSLLRGTADQRQHAASIVASMAQHEAYQTKLGELGAIEPLVEILRTSSLKTAALKALAVLASDNEVNQTKISETGGVGVVVNVINEIKLDEGSEIAGLGEALMALQVASELAPKAIEAGVVPVILKVVQQAPIEYKRQAVDLLADVLAALPEQEAGAEKCVEVSLELLKATELDESLAASALRALTHLTLREDGCAAFVEQYDGVRVMMALQSKLEDEELLESWGIVLANVASNDKFRLTVADTGVLEFFHAQLSSKSEVLLSMAIYGISLLAANNEVCQRIAATRGMCRRIVKLLETGPNDDSKHRAAETVWCLARDETIAAELIQIHGLEELVALVQSENVDAAYCSMMALQHLAASPDNLDVLVEIGAVDAAVASWEIDNEEMQLAALELLKNLSVNADAAKQMVASNAVAVCVAALQVDGSEWKQIALTALANVLKLETAPPNAGDNDSDDEQDEQEEEAYEEEEDADEDDGAEEQDGYAEPSLVSQILEADGIDPLVEILEDSDLEDHTNVILLLDALATADDAAKRKIGGCLSSLIGLVRDGSVAESGAAAAAVVTLVDGSKRNATAAIRARVADAFIKMLNAQDVTVESTKYPVLGLLWAFKALKSPEATTANKKIVATLVELALNDNAAPGAVATAVLGDLAESASLFKMVVEADAGAACARVLTQTSPADEALQQHAGALLVAIAGTKFVNKLVESGVLAQLMPLLKSAPAETRAHIANAAASALMAFPDQAEAIGAIAHVDAVVEMVLHGTYEEQSAATLVLAAVIQAAPSTVVPKLPLPALLDAVLPMLQTAQDEKLRYSTLSLVASLARSDEATRDAVVGRKQILQRVNELLMDDAFDSTIAAIYAVEALLAHADGRTFFADAGGVEKRLEDMRDQYPVLKAAAIDALTTLRAAAY